MSAFALIGRSTRRRASAYPQILFGTALLLLASGILLAAPPEKKGGKPKPKPADASGIEELIEEAAPGDLEAHVEKISSDVAEIRGLPFKRPIKWENQTMKDFEKFLDGELKGQMPEKRRKHYGKIVKALGLYRGPEIKDYFALAKRVMTSQAAAYYDPETKKFYVLAGDLPEPMLSVLFAHELYHGWQDQYFNLKTYLPPEDGSKLNEDEALARQSVVEGEASYIMTLWLLKSSFPGEVPGAALEMTLKMQADMDLNTMKQMIAGGDVAGLDSAAMKDSAEAINELPRFVLETLIGAYMKGMWFVFQIQKNGWEDVAKLYKDRPPASTEQILHPEKWKQDEKPFKLAWPDLKKDPLFRDWEVLDSDTLGEVQLRIVFEEFGLASRSKAAAAGWDGDSYTVLKKEGGEDLMLLLRTCWDTEDDAREFEAAYRDLLKQKFPEGNTTTKIELQVRDVLILEGGDQERAEARMAVLRDLKQTK